MTIPTPTIPRSLSIEREMRSSYLDYAMSVIVSRALPDARDGLKPVHRRILYAMNELGMAPNQPYKKSARIVGEVLGKYHPHGDAPVYDSLVRMAQDFSMRYPLIDGQGNFGSVDDDPPAAMRYTEARLARIAQEMLVDIDRETVDFTANFDASLLEPTILPSRLPNLLVNGASGIAVGMATNIPPHNLGEVCRAVVHLIDDPDAPLDALMRFVRGPDFPTGGIIRGREGIVNAYSTGRGRIVVQARTEIEEIPHGGGRHRILVTELPYQVNKATLVEKIATLAKERRIDGVTDVRDESDRTGMRIVVELRRDVQPELVLNNLYKHTAMQSAFNVNMLALVEGAPRTINLRQALQLFIHFRERVITRRSEYELRKARERTHILEGLRTALLNLDAVIALIRAAQDTEAARTGLMEQFSLSQVQAQAILDMQLRRLSSLERQRLEEEYQSLLQTIAELETLLADPLKLLEVIKEETQKLTKDFSNKRRTEIVGEEPTDFSKEDLTPHQEVVVTLSQRGYIKRIPADTYRLQHRGGRGVRGQTTREADVIQHLSILDTHDTLLFFTNRGRVYALKCFEVAADTSRTTRGMPLVNLVNLAPQEQVQALIAVPNLQQEGFVLLATRRGEIKRMDFRALANIRSNGLIAINIKPGDELVSVRTCGEGDDILMVSQQGQGIRFLASQVRAHSRTAGAIRGIRLVPGDQVVAMDVAVPGLRLFTISQHGYGKLTPVNSFPQQQRGGQGVRAFRVNPKTGPIAAAQVMVDCLELMIISTNAIIIRTPLVPIPVLGRATQGVIIWRAPTKDDTVASIACISSKEEQQTKPEPKKAKTRVDRARARGNGAGQNGPTPAQDEEPEPGLSPDP